jgi:signal transduction histidine kinase
MAAHVTHEIRNPLSSIGLNIELLEDEVASASDKAEAVQLVAEIKAEVERLSRIAEQYLSVARRPRPQLERESIDNDRGVFDVRAHLVRAGAAVAHDALRASD